MVAAAALLAAFGLATVDAAARFDAPLSGYSVMRLIETPEDESRRYLLPEMPDLERDRDRPTLRVRGTKLKLRTTI